MPEIGTSGSMSEDEKRSDATWPQRPRSSSTLPKRHLAAAQRSDAFGAKPTFMGIHQTLFDSALQDRFLDLVAVLILNPGLVTDRSQIMDKPECMLRVVSVYLRGSARTRCFHNHAQRSSSIIPNADLNQQRGNTGAASMRIIAAPAPVFLMSADLARFALAVRGNHVRSTINSKLHAEMAEPSMMTQL